MIAPLAKYIDWWAIQVLAMLIPPANARRPRLEEALQFLKRPDFIPAESQPRLVGIEFIPDKSGLRFRFPTPRPCDFAENNVVHGRLYRCAERWQERPVIVLLHGGRIDFINYRFRFPLIARRCNRAGYNAATLVAPYHFQRRPRQPGALSSPDYLQFAEAMAQAVAEIRALTGWLLGEGCPAVALWGISLGGWLAGLAAGRDARLASVVLTVPGVGFDCSSRERVFWLERAIWPGTRAAWQGQRGALETLNLTPLNLASTQPAISKDNILLIEAIHDLCVPKEAIEELWQAWGRPDIWRLRHGHVGVGCLCVPGLTGRVLRWLAPRLDAPAVRTAQTPILPH
jgi:pimeloyl-ACP methyl ester carboxylesterase